MSDSRVRINTKYLLMMVEDGEINPKELIRNLVTYFSEAEITEFMNMNGYKHYSYDE